MDSLYSIDTSILMFFNQTLSSSWLDTLFSFVSHAHKNPFVLYGFLPLVFSYLAFRYKALAFRGILAVALTAGLSDLISRRLIKSSVQRARPFYNLELGVHVKTKTPAGGYSFPSNHAANCFAGAHMIAWYAPLAAPYVYLYAGLVAISRVYLGAHYPSDVFFGALLGLLIAQGLRAMFVRIRIREPS